MRLLPSRRWIELAICALVVTLVALNAFRRMDYLSPQSVHHIRMTDASRSALVGRNLAEGRGYTTEDMPASLLDFYDTRGKLHDEHWVNADRFPFSAFATAALFSVTRSTSFEVGILVYNLLCFTGFCVALFWLTRRVWGESWSAMLAVSVALLHPYTYIFLYLKDADMLLLVTLLLGWLHRYFEAPEKLSKKAAVVLGTLLAWTFLARPNLGAPIILFFVVMALRLWWRRGKLIGKGAALREHLLREGVAGLAIFLWILPFMIHSMSQWGSPLFSANNLYQLPLGTRFGMGTDTWWKYTEPGHPITLGVIASQDLGTLISKFTSSWLATIKSIVGAYAIELVFAVVMLAGARQMSRTAEEEKRKRTPLDLLVAVVLIAFVINLLVLPLYGYQNYAYRHYLAFGLPLVWLAMGRALFVVGERALPVANRAITHIRGHLLAYLAGVVAILFVWNFAAPHAGDGNSLFSRTSKLFIIHWIGPLVVIGVIVFRRWLFRPPWFPRAALVALTLVYACYRPDNGIKRANLIWFPANEAVWDSLRERKGIVSSFALQGEVAWNTGRKNIPAPEWPMHIYSFWADHEIEVEDLYIESADSLLSTIDGPFSWMAPGFEGYARLQNYRGKLPGYEVAFHDQTIRSYPKYRVKPHAKASTVFKLVDRDAMHAAIKSPDVVELGDPAQVLYTAHGWESYVHFDGRAAVAATNITRSRYGAVEGSYEDTSVTMLLDTRRPKHVSLDVYIATPGVFEFYWNLDLFAYDRPGDRKSHFLGRYEAKTPGWQTVELDVPATMTRAGLNKLGFRASNFTRTVICPTSLDEAGCLRLAPPPPIDPDNWAAPSSVPAVVRTPDVSELVIADVSLFAGTLRFRY